MFTILPHFEQLEQAAELLDKCSPACARLALILVDNMAEVVMYQRTRDEFATDRAFSGSRPPKYLPNKRRDVLWDFDAKVNFVHDDIRIIDADDAKFLKFGHTVRNEAYHKYEYHRDVIIPGARTYFGMVCRLYPHIRITSVGSAFSQY